MDAVDTKKAMKIAVDVDGVLADHVPAVLEQLRKSNEDFTMTKADIQTWDEELPLINSDMKTEIERAESDPEFVLNIPPVDGAVQATNELAQRGHVLVVVTHRPQSLLPATHDWLKSNDIPHSSEESLSTRGGSKSISDADVLIDDYPGHVLEFVNSGKYAILFLQPWNEEHQDELTEHPRIFAADEWSDVVEIIDDLSKTE